LIAGQELWIAAWQILGGAGGSPALFGGSPKRMESEAIRE
jgi:hypothetical protein